ncbi:response regulator [Pelosinus fermentans]|uniref:Transcriptional regulatory protein n=1 Tax=Pelosinus fermentans JBW45 TaxID=1192197 RepID=I9NXS3_9FIRM|nr:response regulator [Pelosinus fermentans]AJQ27918.1 response regulator receiver and unknown domain protein [Pelosinus fermentans JBW45]
MIKVLIVEDDPMVAELNKHYLDQVEGFVLVGMVSNGAEALEFLKLNEVTLILLDIFMPIVDGMELLQSIRSLGHNIDIIMITAARNSASIQNSLRQGVVDYLIKPFQFERLYAALIAYRDRIQLIQDSTVLNQNEIDRRILSKGDLPVGDLPKGIERETLNAILEQAKQYSKPFTTEELAKCVGVSRVSVRKYLTFLKETGTLQARLIYRAVGRPVTMFCYIKQ